MTAAVVSRTVPAQRAPAGEDTPELRARVANGDRAAFAALWRVHEHRIYLFVYVRCGHRQLAEDICAETAARALRNVDRGRYADQGTEFGAWLVTIARNLLADHYKLAATRLEIRVGGPALFASTHAPGERGLDPDEVPLAPDAAALAEQHVHDEQLRAALAAALAGLTPEQRDVVQLRHVEGLSVADTARKLGIDEGAVKARTYRAVRTLARDPVLCEVWEAWR